PRHVCQGEMFSHSERRRYWTMVLRRLGIAAGSRGAAGVSQDLRGKCHEDGCWPFHRYLRLVDPTSGFWFPSFNGQVACRSIAHHRARPAPPALPEVEFLRLPRAATRSRGLRITMHKLLQKPVRDRDTLEGLTQFLFDDVPRVTLTDWLRGTCQIEYA